MKWPTLVGIVNLTPDSFSGDGQWQKDAVAYAKQLVKDGADILDIGAESTRPGATPLTADQEWERLEPFLQATKSYGWRLSVDTRYAETAANALAFGMEIINDVGGLRDPAMLEILQNHSCKIIVMHSLTIPADPSIVMSPDRDVIEAILSWKDEVITRCNHAGIAPERIIYDPGLGFGKTPVQSLTLLLESGRLKATGGQWLIGHSRKSFLTLFAADKPVDRDALTLAFSVQLASMEIDYLRIHNAAAHRTLMDRLCI